MVGISVAEKLKEVRHRILKACQKVGRDPREICLVGVSKLQPISRIQEAIVENLADFGENYVQEWQEKSKEIQNVRWHLIGPLQSNKAKHVGGEVHLIHTVDRFSLAQVISNNCAQKSKKQNILIQVNISGEQSKSGVEPKKLEELLASIQTLKELEVQGFMAMPPISEEAESSRPYFQELRKLRDHFQKKYPKLKFLSMGTTQDFEVAIEEGATHIRVGTSIFGERNG